MARISFSEQLVAVCVVLYLLQFASAWTASNNNECLNRRNALKFAGLSTLTTLVPRSFAEEEFSTVEVVPISPDAKKVGLQHVENKSTGMISLRPLTRRLPPPTIVV